VTRVPGKGRKTIIPRLPESDFECSYLKYKGHVGSSVILIDKVVTRCFELVTCQFQFNSLWKKVVLRATVELLNLMTSNDCRAGDEVQGLDDMIGPSHIEFCGSGGVK